jgi:hypothetical protein
VHQANSSTWSRGCGDVIWTGSRTPHFRQWKHRNNRQPSTDLTCPPQTVHIIIRINFISDYIQYAYPSSSRNHVLLSHEVPCGVSGGAPSWHIWWPFGKQMKQHKQIKFDSFKKAAPPRVTTIMVIHYRMTPWLTIIRRNLRGHSPFCLVAPPITLDLFQLCPTMLESSCIIIVFESISINYLNIVEITLYLHPGTLGLLCGISGGAPLWGGCLIFEDNDNIMCVPGIMLKAILINFISLHKRPPRLLYIIKVTTHTSHLIRTWCGMYFVKGCELCHYWYCSIVDEQSI